uniref:Uncharacterized protein n=1 Tax=Tanacetum cinerariifolium TaxID=118510 RepID=A0A6L2JQJ3_TANCI|nr:hypothetical protein [Tanacetum cinerariifolium]
MPSIEESTTNLPVAEVKTTNRNQEVWENDNLCVISDNSRSARCKKCVKLFKTDSNTTLKTHMNKSCVVVKAAMGSSQTTMVNVGSHLEPSKPQPSTTKTKEQRVLMMMLIICNHPPWLGVFDFQCGLDYLYKKFELDLSWGGDVLVLIELFV